MANPLKDTFDFVITSYAEWVGALRQPWAAAARVLAGETTAEHMKRVTGLWFSSFFLSLIVSLPVYVQFGLKLENMSFQLCVIIAQYLTLLGFAAMFHIALRRHGIRSKFEDTFVLYTVVVAAFGPLVTLVSLPALFRSLLLTSQVKSRALSSFFATAKAMIETSMRPDDTLSTLLVLAAQPFLLVLTMYVLATFVLLLAEHYGAPEATVVRAIAFAFGVLCPALFIVVLLMQQALLLVFIT